MKYAICSKCGAPKIQEEDFHKDKSCKTGFQRYCKTCSKMYKMGEKVIKPEKHRFPMTLENGDTIINPISLSFPLTNHERHDKHRNELCKHMMTCLDLVIENDWESWSCIECKRKQT